MDGFDIRFERRNSVVGRVTEGSAFLLDERGKRVYTLNRLETYVWGLLEDPSSLGDIVTKVRHKFQVSEEVARGSTRGFLEELAQKGIVRVLDRATERR
jgi:hypothetical protein